MALIWNAAPGYKGNQLQPARAGLLAGLGNVLGGVTPVYKSVGSASAQAPARSSSWWPTFSAAPVSATAQSSAAASAARTRCRPDEGADDDPVCVCDDETTKSSSPAPTSVTRTKPSLRRGRSNQPDTSWALAHARHRS